MTRKATQHRGAIAWLRIGAARGLHAWGWAGYAGWGLLLVAAWCGWQAQQWQRAPAEPAAPMAKPSAARLIQTAALPAVPRLPRAADLPALLSQLERAELSQHLAWSQADYQFSPASTDQLAQLEIHCTLKGPYAALRGFLMNALEHQPALAVREFGLSRPSSDLDEVEAKVQLVVFLVDGWDAAEPQVLPPFVPARSRSDDAPRLTVDAGSKPVAMLAATSPLRRYPSRSQTATAAMPPSPQTGTLPPGQAPHIPQALRKRLMQLHEQGQDQEQP